MVAVPASIPSPDQGVWYLGPVPLRAYALIIVLGILVAVWFGNRRWIERGGSSGTVADIALWAVPFGIVGGRLYHVISDNQLYFGPGGSGLGGAVQIWQGGLGIWGAVLGGALGAWIACRRRGIPLPPFGDAIAPAIILAQAIGRFGNYFNQELFGAPTDLPWALQIAVVHRPDGYTQFATFHPTFLYEVLWNLGVFFVLLWADRRFSMGHGRVFALYVALYCLGRAWIESLRIDTANHILGLRLNVWTAVLVGLGAVVYIVVSARLRPGREAPEQLEPHGDSTTGRSDDGSRSDDESGSGGDSRSDEEPPSGDGTGPDAGTGSDDAAAEPGSEPTARPSPSQP
jgi:prolipoprotein diacylglyceryl transferase